MKVFMFKPRFARLVEAGTKRQTVRPWRNNPVHVGDELSLREWTGGPYRSKQRILKTAVCVATTPFSIRRGSVLIDGRCVLMDVLHSFALNDGFRDEMEMVSWFAHEHQESEDFEGFVTYW
jgi:hypothetical protein